jgi:RNA polymerase sigma-70 factor (ECF subfamily)
LYINNREKLLDINALFDNVLQGNENAERELFEKLSVRFRVIAYQRIWNKNDFEDVAQEALLTVAGNFKEVAIERSFTAWATKVLDNKIMAYVKRKQTSQCRLLESPPEDYSLYDERQYSNLKNRLIKCLKRLYRANSRYARIINLHYQGFTVEDVCNRLKVSVDNSYVILSRARSMLTKCLDEQNEVKR